MPGLLPTRPRGEAFLKRWADVRATRATRLWLHSAEIGVQPTVFANDWDALTTGYAAPPAPEPHNCPVVLYCLDEAGVSFCLVVEDYRPWFDVETEDVAEVERALARRRLAASTRTVRLLPSHGYCFEPRVYTRVEVASEREWFQARAALREFRLGNVQGGPLFNFYNSAGVFPSNWFDATGLELLEGRRTTCQIEARASVAGFAYVESTRAPRMVFASFDIEAFSESGRLPKPWREDAPVQDHTICVSVAFWVQGDEPERVVDVTLFVGDCLEPVDERLGEGYERSLDFSDLSEREAALRDAEYLDEPARLALLAGREAAPVSASRVRHVPARHAVRCYATFEEMFDALRTLVAVEADADVVMGFNNYGFDSEFLWVEYLLRRSREDAPPDADSFCAGRNDLALFSGRRLDQRCLLKTKLIENAAQGRNYYRYYDASGRANCDVMQIFQKEDKGHQSYALGALASALRLPQLKVDLSPHQMFDIRRTRDPRAQAAIAYYCAFDARIPIQLYIKKKWHEQMLAISAVSCTALHDIFNCGQGIRTTHMILRRCFQKQMCPLRRGDGVWQHPETGEMLPYDPDKPLYQGAIVLPPSAQFFREPVTTLDYASLYPSCI